MKTKEETDMINRDIAVNLTGGNILVAASAGSGKTTALSARVLNNIKKKISIANMLILTFTKLAGLNMKEKIRERLRDFDNNALSEEEKTKQLNLLSAAYVCTFDSFTHSVVNKYYYRLNLPKNISVIDENIYKIKRKEILKEIFERRYQKEDPAFIALIKAFVTKKDKTLQMNILDLYNQLDLLTDKKRKEVLNKDYRNESEIKQTIIDIIKELDTETEAFKREFNCYTYTDINKMAIRIIENNPDIRKEIKESFKEVIIDEYQDTSDIQEELIGLISENNLFMVGDVKQSIYQFRNANPRLFIDKYVKYGTEKMTQGFKIPLFRNFRSRKENIDFVNAIFSKLMSGEDDEIIYTEDHMMIPGKEEYLRYAVDCDHNPEFLTYNADRDIKEDDTEASIIVNDIIKKVKERYTVMTADEEGNYGERPVRYRDFAVITRTKEYFDAFNAVFRHYGIPLQIQKETDATDSVVIALLCNIITLILDDLTDITKHAFISVLRSYLFETSDAEIFEMNRDITYTDTEAYRLIGELQKEAEKQSIGELMMSIDAKFGIIAKAHKIKNIRGTVAEMEYALSLADGLSDLGYDLRMFRDYLKEIVGKSGFAFSDEEKLKMEIDDKLTSSETPDAVQLLTVHKAKGLEYKICYYPDLSHGFNFKDKNRKFFYDEETGFAVSEEEEAKKIYRKKAIGKVINEEKRLLYVALTRAEEQIVLVGHKEEKGNKFMYWLWDFLSDTGKYKINNLKTTFLKDETIDKYLNFLKETKGEMPLTGKKLTVCGLKLPPREIIAEKSYSKRVSELLSKKDHDKMRLGQILHEALEKIDFNTRDYTSLHLDPRFYSYPEMFFKSELWKDADKAVDIYREFEFIDENGRSGFIDLMIEYEDRIDIIDYKTKNIDDEAYVHQLLGYKEEIGKRTNKSVKAYLYSLLEGKKKEV